jgi:Transmembrane domain of unknown function (DUF3566)
MTETQAKSGTAEGAKAADAESEAPAQDGAGADATGRAVVGRAAVHGDKADGSPDTGPAASGKSAKPTATGAAAVPKFTRAPGMAPPPDVLLPGQSAEKADAAGSPADATAVTPGAGAAGMARASVRGAAPVGRGSAVATQPLGVGMRPGPEATGGVGPRLDRPVPGSPVGPGGPGGRVGDAIRNARAAVTAAASRGPRRARLYLKRVDPWSVMKFSFAVSFVLFIVGVVATAVLYMALDTMGVVSSVNKALGEMVGATGGDVKSTFRITAKGIIVGAGLIGLVNVVLFTALATLSAFIYNVCSDLVGGIELTLAEKE